MVVWARAATSASRLKLQAAHCGSHMLVHTCPRTNSESHIDASHSRQPLVNGDRLVRYEVNAVMGISQAAGLPALLRLSLWWLLRVAATSSTSLLLSCSRLVQCWAKARIKIARMTLTVKLDGNWSSFQLADSAPPLSVTDSAIAPSARM